MRMAAVPLRDPAGAFDGGPVTGGVVVTGADGALGRRVVALLRGARDARPVLALAAPGAGDRGASAYRPIDLLVDDLEPVVDGAAVIVHLASAFGPTLDEDPAIDRAEDVTAAQRLLEAAGDAGVAHLVVLSSATVYGAWANNALPLTEDATLRPGPELAFAVQRAEIERRVAEWRQDHPAATAAVLRPAPVVGDDGEIGWLAQALHAARRVADLGGDPPAQFLHVDDLAAAVVLAATAHLDGARNVAPDGWLRGAEYTALDAGTPKLRLPPPVGDRVARLRGRLRLTPTPPGLRSYARHPWVIANDRLKADGWIPAHSNEEAFVDGTPATALATLSPRRRQELALGVSGGVLAVGLAAGTWAGLRRRARR
jgi:nucleoside-diphosphate-sugar epimerase